MRHLTLALAAALCWPATHATAQDTPVPLGTPNPTTSHSASSAGLSLAQALSLAETANPALRAKQAQLAAAEAAASDATASLANNPQLSLERTRRDVPDTSGTERRNEWNAGLSQAFEIAGQGRYRRQASSSALEALRLEIDDLRRQQQAEVAQRFYRVVALQQRAELETQAVKLFDDTAQAVERRRGAGEDTRLDANVALVEAERARNQLASVQEQLIEARAALAVPLQLPFAQLPQVIGDLDIQPPPYSEALLLEQAPTLPRLQALAARAHSAQARLQLEQAARYPDVTLGVNVGREGSTQARERLTTLTFSVPLPLFKHNGAAIGVASSEATQALIERQAAERDVPAQIHALWSRLESLRQRIDRLQRSVLPALAKNEALSVKSLRAGQIGLLELIVTNRQSLDARRDLVDAQIDYLTTRLTLEAAAGWTSQP